VVPAVPPDPVGSLCPSPYWWLGSQSQSLDSAVSVESFLGVLGMVVCLFVGSAVSLTPTGSL